MTPQELDDELRSGRIRPIYLVTGDERYLADKCVRRLREAALAGAVADFNEDVMNAEGDIDRVLNAVRTAPMMAARRFVLVRGIERWEGRGDDRPSAKLSPLDALADYAQAPVDSTCLVLTGAKLDARRRFSTVAKKLGFHVNCELLSDGALAAWVARAFADRGCKTEPGVAELLAEVAGPELGHVADAVERLALYVGKGGSVSEAAISEVVVRVRETSVFALVEAVSKRDPGAALALLGDVFDPRSGGLPLVGLLAWSVRQLLRFEAALRGGARPEEAAKLAGAPPFKARDLAAQLRSLSRPELERWLLVLADADIALKSSRRPPRAVLESLLLAMAYRPARPAPALVASTCAIGRSAAPSDSTDRPRMNLPPDDPRDDPEQQGRAVDVPAAPPLPLVITARAVVPTRFGSFETVVFRREGAPPEPYDLSGEHVALVAGNVRGTHHLPVRVHSECLTSEVFGSLKCDCKEQLEAAQAEIARRGAGVLLYLRQEGRGIGLANKIRAYALQAQGADTVDANRMLGLPDDARRYDVAADMLRALGVESIGLMTNNPEKVEQLRALGVKVESRIPVLVRGNPYSSAYLDAKRRRMRHALPVRVEQTEVKSEVPV